MMKKITERELERSLKMTLEWFEHSGVMLPADGSWGVAERILLTENNPAAEVTLRSFPAWTDCGEWAVLEQRRADCCMQTAFLYLLAFRALGCPEHYDTARMILRYLYNRSGLLKRFRDDTNAFPPGVWNWSHIKWNPKVYFDDNAWMCMLQLRIGTLFQELNDEFEMTSWGMKLADSLAEAAPKYLSGKVGTAKKDFSTMWQGKIRQPHWGSLVSMALAEAESVSPETNPEYRKWVRLYHKYLLENTEFSKSEYCYAVLGAVPAYRVFHDEESRDAAEFYGKKILDSMDPATGNIAAEHNEAPVGPHLVDTIYTMNWAVLALQELAALDEKYRKPLQKIMELLLKIQETSPCSALFGCWRGMFDLKTGKWGGGDCFEGGACSIYTGWTNAPIAWAMANELIGWTLASAE